MAGISKYTAPHTMKVHARMHVFKQCSLLLKKYNSIMFALLYRNHNYIFVVRNRFCNGKLNIVSQNKKQKTKAGIHFVIVISVRIILFELDVLLGVFKSVFFQRYFLFNHRAWIPSKAI